MHFAREGEGRGVKQILFYPKMEFCFRIEFHFNQMGGGVKWTSIYFKTEFYYTLMGVKWNRFSPKRHIVLMRKKCNVLMRKAAEYFSVTI